MLHYELVKKRGCPLYECLYECLREDILRGRLLPGTKLPSRRELARDNGISVKTVVNAYEQLLVEGYLIAKEKKGYFVADVETMDQYHPEKAEYPQLYREEKWFADFTANNTIYEKFPFSMWRKVMREVLSEYDMELVQRAHFLGVRQLREVIADYLYRLRGIVVSPECIVIGAGIEYLYGKLVKLLPGDSVYGVENPGYKKIPRIYEEYGLSWRYTEMDENGISMESLRESGADVIHVSPEHHYPLGTVMSAARRQELLNWAVEKEGRYVIEDDYDCEFRYRSRSIPALKSMDRNGRVIYMNTFSKTLAPAIRIIRQSSLLPVADVRGGESGTHLLVKLDTSLTDGQIREKAKQQGILVACLSQFCTRVRPEYERVLVLNYSDMDEGRLREAVRRLGNVFMQW